MVTLYIYIVYLYPHTIKVCWAAHAGHLHSPESLVLAVDLQQPLPARLAVQHLKYEYIIIYAS